MERNGLKKIVYEDNGERVIKGYIIDDGEFLIKINPEDSSETITIGKRAIIKISDIGDKR